MSDTAASVLARLKKVSIETGRNYQLCLQLFCQEEFMRRLEKSRFANNFILKGGLFLYTLTNFTGRVTLDIDFLLRSLKNTPNDLRAVVQEIIDTDVGNDFVRFEIQNVAPIAVTKKYAGVGINLLARIKNTRTPIQIDFGVGDVIVPGAITRTIPTQLLDFSSPLLHTYSLETTLAEKADAILSLMNLSSRMKDYYDIFYLSRHYDFDGTILTEAFQKTFANRNHEFTCDQLDQINSFATDPTMLTRWKAFVKRTDTICEDFSEILSGIHTFLSPLMHAVLNDRNFDSKWYSQSCSWEMT